MAARVWCLMPRLLGSISYKPCFLAIGFIVNIHQLPAHLNGSEENIVSLNSTVKLGLWMTFSLNMFCLVSFRRIMSSPTSIYDDIFSAFNLITAAREEQQCFYFVSHCLHQFVFSPFSGKFQRLTNKLMWRIANSLRRLTVMSYSNATIVH